MDETQRRLNYIFDAFSGTGAYTGPQGEPNLMFLFDKFYQAHLAYNPDAFMSKAEGIMLQEQIEALKEALGAFNGVDLKELVSSITKIAKMDTKITKQKEEFDTLKKTAKLTSTDLRLKRANEDSLNKDMLSIKDAIKIIN